MQTLDSYVAAAQVADRHAAARSSRAARRARKAAGTNAERLVLRRAAAEDGPALARLARLDSAPSLRATCWWPRSTSASSPPCRSTAGARSPTRSAPPPTSSTCSAPAPSCSPRSVRPAPRSRLRLPRVRVA